MNKLIPSINIPNLLTIGRILMIPLFVIFIMDEALLFALLVFTFAGISDGLDGLIARYYNQTTVFGAYLDPIADKLLLASAFVSLAILKIIPGWLAVIVISRDIVIVFGIALCRMSEIKVEIKPTIISKCTTFFQLLTVFLVLLFYETRGDLLNNHSALIYMMTAALTTASGFHYIYKGMVILQND